MRKGGVIARYLEALSDGDPYAVGLTIAFAVAAAGLGLVVWFVSRRAAAEEKRHQEKRRARGY